VRIRDLQTGEEWTIPDSDGAYGLEFSADGSWLLMREFGAVRRTPVRGGRPVEVVGPAGTHDAVWGPGDTMLYVSRGTLMRVPLGGGAPESILVPDSTQGQRAIHEPFVTLDGSTIIVEIEGSGGQRIGIFDYPSLRERGVIDPGGDRPMYLESGHLVYNVSGEMMGRPFDLATATALGPPAPIASDVTPRAWSVSRAGLMASAFQIVFSASGSRRGDHLVRQYWNEEPELLSVQADLYDDMDLADDARMLAVEVEGEEDGYLWVIDLSTGVRNQLTFRGGLGGGDDPVWSPDGDSVLYVQRGGNTSLLRVQAADGSGDSRILLERDGERFSDPSWSTDRSTIAYATLGAGTDDEDIWLLDVPSGISRAGIGGGGFQNEPHFSPDGQYLLYQSDEGDESAGSIFVRPTDLSGARWDVSRGVGGDARWAPDGSAIYFRRGSAIIQVRVETENGFRILGNPEPVIVRRGRVGDWALLPDGSGIISVMTQVPDDESGPSRDIPVDLVFNWFAELEEKAPHPRDR
jgi:WD40-like Beta Propeller Repeat